MAQRVPRPLTYRFPFPLGYRCHDRYNEPARGRARVQRFHRSPFDEVRFLITGEQTGGAMFMAEVSIAPGCGNPPHIHSHHSF